MGKAKLESIEVIPIGTEVKIIGNDLHGKIEKIIIGRENVVFYDVGYWESNSKTIGTLHHSEVVADEKHSVKIGFGS
jgi:hypothetical protein